MTDRNAPDRSGMLILPGGLLIAALWFSIALVWDAIELSNGSYTPSEDSSARVRLLSGMISALAGLIGLVPSVLVGIVAVGGAGVFLLRTIRAYRAAR